MKTFQYKFFAILFLAITITDIATAKKSDVEKRKVIEKSYSVNNEVLLDISNQFGKVHINTWEKNQMDVTIEIIVRKRSESRAQELMDRIDIDVNESPMSKRFVTVLKGNFNNSSNGTFEINYTVNMPKNNPLRLKNKFGNNYIGDLTNDVDLKISYGDIKTESFTGKSDINLSFGDGEFKFIKTGELEIKYSDVEIEELGIVRLEQGYSDLEIDKAESIDLTSKYGDIEIGTIVGIKGYVGYSGFEIDRLISELDIEASYASGFRISEVASGFNKIDIYGKFGSYKLGFEDGVNATFDAKMKFSDLDYSGLDIDFSYKVKEDFRSEYRGTIGNGKGGDIRIVSSYGDVRFY